MPLLSNFQRTDWSTAMRPERCEACESAAERRSGGNYDFNCPRCCARLIVSARPSRLLQEGHIAALRTFHGKAWDEFWTRVQAELARQ
jgi:predicted RNA-binding Zn-ribbon protein involved in translation (DUF1610 family)